MIKKIITVFLLFVLCLNVYNADELTLNSDKVIMYNLNDNEIIFQKNINDRTSVASLTKIMSVIVAIENIDDFDKKVTITNKMLENIEKDVSVAGLKAGEVLTYNDLLYASMLPSGADAINSLGISIFGSIDNYVKKMNEKAQELVLLNTNFTDPIGLRDQDNYSSAYDIAKILTYALKNEKFKEVFTAKRYKLSSGKELKSTLVYFNEKYTKKDLSYITGSKTGFTDGAGLCLASTSSFDDINYLLITLNADPKIDASHVKDTIKIYEYFQNNYSYNELVSKNEAITNVKVKGTKEKNALVYSNSSLKKYINNNYNKSDVRIEYYLDTGISYFTEKGSVVGKANVFYKNNKVGVIDLIFNSDLTFSLTEFIKDYFKTFVSIMFLLICFIISVFLRHMRMKRYSTSIRLSDY